VVGGRTKQSKKEREVGGKSPKKKKTEAQKGGAQTNKREKFGDRERTGVLLWVHGLNGVACEVTRVVRLKRDPKDNIIGRTNTKGGKYVNLTIGYGGQWTLKKGSTSSLEPGAQANLVKKRYGRATNLKKRLSGVWV